MAAPRLHIDLSLPQRNMEKVRERLSPGIGVYAVLKADAYGHGIEPVASALNRVIGLRGYAVFDPWEGATIRRTGWAGEIVCLRPLRGELLHQGVEHNLALTIDTWDQACDASQVASVHGVDLVCHLNIDTGLTRFGDPAAEALRWAERVNDLPGLRLTHVWTHLADGWNDPNRTIGQLHELDHFRLRSGLSGVRKHVGGTDAIVLANHLHDGDAIRMGRGLFGVHPGFTDLIPVMSFGAPVLKCRPVPAGSYVGYGNNFQASRAMDIAIVGAGTKHGIPWSLSNRGGALVRGQYCRVVGQVGMNTLTLDVSHVPTVAEGDEVILVGEQGDRSISLHEVARRAQAKATELLVQIGQLNDRCYAGWEPKDDRSSSTRRGAKISDRGTPVVEVLEGRALAGAHHAERLHHGTSNGARSRAHRSSITPGSRSGVTLATKSYRDKPHNADASMPSVPAQKFDHKPAIIAGWPEHTELSMATGF